MIQSLQSPLFSLSLSGRHDSTSVTPVAMIHPQSLQSPRFSLSSRHDSVSLPSRHDSASVTPVAMIQPQSGPAVIQPQSEPSHHGALASCMASAVRHKWTLVHKSLSCRTARVLTVLPSDGGDPWGHAAVERSLLALLGFNFSIAVALG